MDSTLIVIRGNSASGKSTIAQRLQSELGPGTLLVPQDVVRRNMLRVHDTVGNLSIGLIESIAKYGRDNCKYVILEGILSNRKYGDMLRNLINDFDDNAYVYYFELPFEETVRRHNLRAKREAFGEDELRSWYNPTDHLGINNETILTEEMSGEEILSLILRQFNIEKSE